MIESSSVEVGSRDLTHPAAFFRPLSTTLESSRWLALTAVLAIAAMVRLPGLAATGFSEDEINKLAAVRAYSHGNFADNAEHPMAMKLADWMSLRAAAWWNATHAQQEVAAEAALRLPNALVGAATSVALFLAAEALFDTTVGAWAALLWALDVNAAGINRIGKEDTFFLFFLLIAVWCFERAKQVMTVPAVRDRWFNWSGAAFGVMLASKYLPGFFGLHAAFNIAADGDVEDKTPDKRLPFYAAMAAAFVAVNFAVLLPSTWAYVLGYLHGDTLRHTGYMFWGRLYVNEVAASPWGTPPWFYLTFLVTKVPLVVLGAAAIGLAWTARHSRHRGATFIRVFLVLTLLPYSLVASKFVRYLLPVLAVLDVAAAVGVAWLIRRARRIQPAERSAAVTMLLAAALVVPLGAHAVRAAPYYALAQNTIGARLAQNGLLFPDDELYDAGVREAVDAIARVAPAGAVLCSDATAVVSEYLRRDGRTDITACSIARDGLPMQPRDTWVIAQEGHIYFENQLVIEQIARRYAPWLELRVGGFPAAVVYHLSLQDGGQ